jgi:hypothetical protein
MNFEIEEMPQYQLLVYLIEANLNVKERLIIWHKLSQYNYN